MSDDLDILLPHDLEFGQADLFQSNDNHVSIKSPEFNAEIRKNPNNIELWKNLFSNFDELINESISPEDSTKNSLDEETKTKIHNAYKTLLSRFPYLEEIWKNWTIVEFKMNGKEASIDVLRLAVENFPTSIALWSDYLAALKTTDVYEDIEKFRFIYNEALKNNSYHFNSEVIWDKIFEFESDLAKKKEDVKSTALLELYLKVIHIPLYQYARYYTQFSEINKNYDINLLLPPAELQNYATKFGKTKPEELSLIEKHQIIDDYFSTVFSKTQFKVSSNWEYEQSLLHQNFEIDRTEIDKEFRIWIEYLDIEIRIYKNLPSGEESKIQFDLVVNLFERSLIPNCYNSDLWLKYIKFIYNSKTSEDEKFEKQQQIYLRANSKFIPLDNNILRIMYSKFLLSHNKYEQANEYLFDWMKVFSGISKQYYKSSYLEICNEIISNWQILITENDLQTILEQIINTYFDIREPKIKKEKKEKVEMKEEQPKEVPSENHLHLSLSNEFINLFTKFLIDDSIPLIVNTLLNIYKLQNQPSKIRKFFNQNHNHKSLTNSLQFWKFIFEYEAQVQNNLENLKSIYHLITTESNLPKSFLNMFIDWYYDIVSANIIEFLKLNKNKSDETLILKDLNLSNSVYYNKIIRKNQEKNNYKLNQSKKAIDEDPYTNFISKQVGHPGVFVDQTPEITNKFMNEGNWIDLTQKNIQIPPYPTYKGVEKAQAPIKYQND
ncbi:PRP39 [Candida jiufengensis]|uniref:PRP39 n=1 Tax=Candida jiufengensis TaxID=497108 RepID=UPI0022248FC1|nr:PRP39 [Candida jiufengensis]KAI5951457.1 PRP39 [Candida jiufengensis]